MKTEEFRVLFSVDAIRARVAELGKTITDDYRANDGTLVVVSVLKGAHVFSADLARAIDLPLRLEFLGVRSYGNATRSSGVVQLTQDVSQPLAGEHVLIVEDIVDTGLTSHYLLEQLGTRNPRSLRLCALLHKPGKAKKPVRVDYAGFTVDEDVFVVGYGLDHAELYRNLPDIRVLPGVG